MLIQDLVRHDSIIASQRLVVEFCNKIGQEKTSIARFVADQCRRLETERFIADGGFLIESIAPYP